MPMELSHIWLGRFSSNQLLDEYFEEQYDDDDAPINAFAADQGESYYDHDWVELGFDESCDLRALIVGASYSSDYLSKVISRASELEITTANTFILADAQQFPEPKSVEGEGYKLWYVGAYKCNIQTSF